MVKPLSGYYAAADHADGHYNTCKECHRAVCAERQRTYRKTARGRDVNNQALSRWRQNHPRRALAHKLTAAAIRRGELVRQPCEKCSEPKVEAHHPDYDKPLEVNWLCMPCHKAEHVRLREEGIEL